MTDPADSVVSATQGSFQLLQFQGKEHKLVGYRSMPKFKEFDGSGNVALKGQFGNSPYEANACRIFKFPWKGTPRWDPVWSLIIKPYYVANLYINRNGATKYDNWAIFSVPFETSTLLEGSNLLVSKRTGFETHVPLRDPRDQFYHRSCKMWREDVGQVFSCAVSVLNALR